MLGQLLQIRATRDRPPRTTARPEAAGPAQCPESPYPLIKKYTLNYFRDSYMIYGIFLN